MSGDTRRQILVVLATLAVIGVNGAANALPLNEQTTGEISNRFDVYFVPEGYVFSIWGVIYAGLLAYTLYQLAPGQKRNPRLQAIGYIYVLSAIANIAWLFLWHYEFFPATMLAMVALLLSLIAIYLLLDVGRVRVSGGEAWLVHLPFSIYLGWVSVATIANATVVLESVQWDGWGLSEPTWAVIMLVVGAVLATLVGLTRGDVAFILVFIWAFAGIAVAQADEPLVSLSAWALAGVLVVVMALSWLRQRRQPRRRVPTGYH
jgi:hypothetical protein